VSKTTTVKDVDAASTMSTSSISSTIGLLKEKISRKKTPMPAFAGDKKILLADVANREHLTGASIPRKEREKETLKEFVLMTTL
jgi:hypothetical protein